MNIDEIKGMMRSGDIAGAEAVARELLIAEPCNVRAKILCGTCRQLQGDEAGFRRIHGELAQEMASVADDDARRMWRRFDEQFHRLESPELVRRMDYCEAGAALVEYIVVGFLIVTAVGLAVYFFGKSGSSGFWCGDKAAVETVEQDSPPPGGRPDHKPMPQTKYGGPKFDDMLKQDVK